MFHESIRLLKALGISVADCIHISSLMVEYLSSLYQLSSNIGVTFVYCNYKEPRTPATYIRLAIKQLCRRMQYLPPKLQGVYEKHYRNDSQPNSSELQSIFLESAKYFNGIFMVLDALDECTADHRAELSEFFSNIIALSITSNSTLGGSTQPMSPRGIVKLFVTSRKEPDIERVFRQRSFPTVEIEAKKVDRDIAIYVKAQMEQRIKDERLIIRKMILKDKILTTLTTQASGMYGFPNIYYVNEYKILINRYYCLGSYGSSFSWMKFVHIHKSRMVQ